MLSANNKRPVFLTLYLIRLPVTAVLSILHRIFGVVLVLAIPFLIYQLDQSVASAQAYAEVIERFSSPWLRFVGMALVWFLLFHLLSGLRFLSIDLGIGTERSMARKTAWLTHAVALIAAVLLIGICL